MNSQLIKTEIQRFLASSTPEVLCVSGHWGVGKTYAWNLYLKEAHAGGHIALPRYSYVSLFGVNSLEELKYSIYENSVAKAAIGIEPSLETLQSHTAAVLKPLGRKSLRLFARLPFVTKYVGELGPAWFLTVRDTVVCIDDIERRGEKLDLRDVLGLISTLRERRRCKIALILNDDALAGDSRTDFNRYFEKVIDVKLDFAPTAQESVEIALPSATIEGRMIAEDCVALGISNIRVIKKIERSVNQIKGPLSTFDALVLKQAVQSITLLGWSVYEPDAAPSLEFLKSREARRYSLQKQTASEKDSAWNALLEVYGFSVMDEFDLVVLQGIQRGFFEPSKVMEQAALLNKKVVAAQLTSELRAAWRPFHDSFDDNEAAVVKELSAAFYKCLSHLSPTDVNSTVSVFKKLGRRIEAKQMLEAYIHEITSKHPPFDVNSYPFKDRIDDPDVLGALQVAFASTKPPLRAIDVLTSMAEKNGWHPDDVAALSNVESDEYYQIFKAHRGVEMKKLINACLKFGSHYPEGSAEKAISLRAKDALRRIGAESAINRLRLLQFGIHTDPESDT